MQNAGETTAGASGNELLTPPPGQALSDKHYPDKPCTVSHPVGIGSADLPLAGTAGHLLNLRVRLRHRRRQSRLLPTGLGGHQPERTQSVQ